MGRVRKSLWIAEGWAERLCWQGASQEFVLKLILCLKSLIKALLTLYSWLPRHSATQAGLHWCRNPGRGSHHATMQQSAGSTALAELVKSLDSLHHSQHEVLMDIRRKQENRLLAQANEEDQRAIQSLLGQEVQPGAAPPIAHVPLVKKSPHDDPEAFMNLFEKTAEACGWDCAQWPVRLILLL